MKNNIKLRPMNRNDILTATTVAVGTAALAITVFWPDALDAGDREPLPAGISEPKLFIQGVELRLSPEGGRNFSGGEQPVFELAAVNTNSASATICVHVAMNATSPADALSRVVRTPSPLWQDDQTIVLRPGEQKTLILSTKTKLPANSLISVALQDKGASVNGAALSVAGVLGEPKLGALPRTSMITALTFFTSGTGPAAAPRS